MGPVLLDFWPANFKFSDILEILFHEIEEYVEMA